MGIRFECNSVGRLVYVYQIYRLENEVWFDVSVVAIILKLMPNRRCYLKVTRENPSFFSRKWTNWLYLWLLVGYFYVAVQMDRTLWGMLKLFYFVRACTKRMTKMPQVFIITKHKAFHLVVSWRSVFFFSFTFESLSADKRNTLKKWWTRAQKKRNTRRDKAKWYDLLMDSNGFGNSCGLYLATKFRSCIDKSYTHHSIQ